MLVKESAKDIWEAALGELQLQLSRTNYDTWLKDTVGLSYQGDQFVVGVPSTFSIEWLEKRLTSLIQKTLIGIIGDGVSVGFQIHEHSTTARSRGNGKPAAGTNHRKTGSNHF